ncbi:LysR family transcriptional regulator [Azospirillum sp. SYSU D00513]|uniref:LysR family transcriptional regulator n=1 Tax=Azospirillum sp. SYSU D00513 TaxID=2812561 RepID=UPI001A958A0C|nr:LysR family transcriptional regulator [Azospirillum sp. SYSU D00513]
MALLENMRVFVRVVDLGSLSAAGRSLRLSPAVVSHRLQSLEEHLNARLLNRTTRQVQLTEAGQVFYEHCQEVLDAAERAESSVAAIGGAPAGSLRVTAPLGFGRQVLAPLVPKFREAHPLVDVRLRLSDHMLDLLREAVDVAIRMAVLRDSSLVVRRVGELRRVLCAAPSYLEEKGTPARPEDLLDHHCLLLRFPGSQQYHWTLQGEGGPMTLPVSGRFDADDGDVLTQWAVEGQGIVLKPLWEVAGHLESGALRTILPDNPPEPVSLAVLYPHRNLLPAKVRAFTDFLVDHLRADLTRRHPDALF